MIAFSNRRSITFKVSDCFDPASARAAKTTQGDAYPSSLSLRSSNAGYAP
jgi:hypothetical protein